MNFCVRIPLLSSLKNSKTCYPICGRCGIRTHGTFTSYSLANCCNNHSANLPYEVASVTTSKVNSDLLYIRTNFIRIFPNKRFCGRCRIRTYGTPKCPTVFKTATINHSVNLPFVVTVGIEPTLFFRNPVYQTGD